MKKLWINNFASNGFVVLFYIFIAYPIASFADLSGSYNCRDYSAYSMYAFSNDLDLNEFGHFFAKAKNKLSNGEIDKIVSIDSRLMGTNYLKGVLIQAMKRVYTQDSSVFLPDGRRDPRNVDAALIDALATAKGFAYFDSDFHNISGGRDATRYFLEAWFKDTNPDHLLYASRIVATWYGGLEPDPMDHGEYESTYKRLRVFEEIYGVKEASKYLPLAFEAFKSNHIKEEPYWFEAFEKNFVHLFARTKKCRTLNRKGVKQKRCPI